MGIEYRLTWSASSNGNFSGASDWTEWDDDEATADEVETALSFGKGQLPPGLEEVLEASGFSWNVETRESGSDA